MLRMLDQAILILLLASVVIVAVAVCGEVALRRTRQPALRDSFWVALFIGTGIVVVLGTIASLLAGVVK